MSIVKEEHKATLRKWHESCRKNAAIVPVCGVAQRLMCLSVRRVSFSADADPHVVENESQEWRFTALALVAAVAANEKPLMNGSLLPRSWRR